MSPLRSALAALLVSAAAVTFSGAAHATFILDSLTGRNLAEVCTKAPALRPIQRISDAYGALTALSKYPKIDPKRVALMGFSHGGGDERAPVGIARVEAADDVVVEAIKAAGEWADTIAAQRNAVNGPDRRNLRR